MLRRTSGLTAIGLAALGLATLGANCVGPVKPPKTTGEPKLRAFSSEAELRSFLASQATAGYRQSFGNGGFGMPVMADQSNTAPAGPPAPETSGGAGYSTTNIQEVGVDESDIVKNNGDTIYMLTADKVHVVKATPAEGMAEVATIPIDSSGNSLYLVGNRLVALSGYGYYGWGYDGMDPMPMVSGVAVASPGMKTAANSMLAMLGGPWSDGNQTTVTLIDVSNPSTPAVTKTIRFEGSLANSRLIGSKLHLVLTTMPRLPANPTPENIEAMTTDEWLPQYQVVTSDGSTTGGPVVGWQGCLRPDDPNGYAMTMVVTLDISNPDAPFDTTAVTANVGVIYASTQALYLTDTQYSYADFSSRTDTVVHKLKFNDTGTDYVASGVVPGRPLSQYSLGEYKDYLRIATTNERYNMRGDSLSSGVYVLGTNGATLDVVGKVENIAPGEKIYSARFLDNRGFLVTFRRIDPLFVMDLSEPTNPRIVGELKVPGYSDHIQLLDDNHLLTIGRDTVESGNFAWVQGVLLTIFDVTDPAHPQILKVNGQDAREVIGGRGTYSEANNNPKAFNFYRDRNALAFPIDLYDGHTTGPDYGTHSFTGLYVYRVTVEKGFEKLGQIASAEGVTSNDCFQGYYGTTRGVFIGNNVYGVTDRGVKAASIDSVSTLLGEVTFADAPTPLNDCFWATDMPVMALPPSSDLR